MRTSVLVAAFVVVAACAQPPPLAPAPPAHSPRPASLSLHGDAAAACADLRQLEDNDRIVAEGRAASAAADPEAATWGGMETRIAHGKTQCSVADDNIQSLEDAILAGPAPNPAVSPVHASPTGPPKYLDRIDQRFLLDAHEHAALASNGFVVPARLTSSNYGMALHEIYQSELPIFITSDALLHAVYAGNDKVLSRVETSVLEPTLRRALAQMTCALPTLAASYPRDVVSDLDVYLGVATALFKSETDPVPTSFSDGRDVATIVAALNQAEGLLGAPGAEPFVLFGRPRVVDASMFRPRGHYTSSLSQYFRASMWLSRLEFNLVSRSCKSSHPSASPDPGETPREELDALALSDLSEKSGALPLLAKVDRAWSVLAGRREDVSLTDLVALRKTADIRSLDDPRAAEKLRRAIGTGWKRTARTHFTPMGTTELPVIATILGARIGPDTAPTKRLVQDAIPGRTMLHAAEMAYVLGNDRAKTWLTKDLHDFPALTVALDLARADERAAGGGEDLYSLWMRGVVGLAGSPRGTLPSFMTSAAWSDLRLDTTIAAFGQIRHNYVLMAAGTYESYGCQIPDGYVEPAPEMLDAIVDYAERGAKAVGEIDASDAGVAYFLRLAKVMKTLRRIVATEQSGSPLTEEQKRFLGMVAENALDDYHCMDSCGPPTFTGWWYDLFIDRVADGTSSPVFIADYYTSTNTGQVAYIGARAPRLGIFVVDTNGERRAMVGPVAHAYEHVDGVDHRLTDEESVDVKDLVEPWAASYTVPAPKEPTLTVTEIAGPPARREPLPVSPLGRSRESRATITLEAKSDRQLGPLTLELLDHHRRAIAAITHSVAATPVRYVFPPGSIRGGPAEATGIRVRIGDASFTSTDTFSMSLDETP